VSRRKGVVGRIGKRMPISPNRKNTPARARYNQRFQPDVTSGERLGGL
jgi:hypothetical protein